MADIRRLPVPVTSVWDWQMQASCRDMDSELFFHPERERGPARAHREARAKVVCRACPVRRECREHALAVREPYGIWGGLSEVERGEHRRSYEPAPLLRRAVPGPAQPVPSAPIGGQSPPGAVTSS